MQYTYTDSAKTDVSRNIYGSDNGSQDVTNEPYQEPSGYRPHVTLSLFYTRCNILLSSTPRSPKWFLPFGFCDKILSTTLNLLTSCKCIQRLTLRGTICNLRTRHAVVSRDSLNTDIHLLLSSCSQLKLNWFKNDNELISELLTIHGNFRDIFKTTTIFVKLEVLMAVYTYCLILVHPLYLYILKYTKQQLREVQIFITLFYFY
jgi:hypothetical protein